MIMKSKIYIIMTIMFCVIDVFAQDIYQQTHIELNTALDDAKSYACQATSSIKLLPGFEYKPDKMNSLSLEIDRYSVFPPTDGYYCGEAGMSDGVVGSLPSSFNISNTGAAVYSVDMKLPDAIGNMTPSLSFVYNSQSANGIMGWAWEVSGLSSIERVGQTVYHDGNVTDVNFVNDRFALDGQRLMLVGGKYGEDKSEYKTEIDNFDKIVAHAINRKSPHSFTVWKSDGTIWEYGNTFDSKIEAMKDNDIVIKWMLSKISDRNGNAILFSYDKNNENGEIYINNIEYTLNDKANVAPAYRVSFHYENKNDDVIFVYVNGNKMLSKRILKNVKVTNNYTGKIVYDYSLDYHKPGMYGRSYFIHYRLKSITLNVGEDKINPTRIIWNDEKKHYPSSSSFQMYQLDKNVFSKVPFVGDFNGDGFSDVLMVPYKIQNTYPDDIEAEVYLNNGDGGFQEKPMTKLKLSKNLEWIYIVDLNGDGVDDIIPYEIDYNAQNYEGMQVNAHFYILEKGGFVKKKTFKYEKNIVLLAGRFMHNDRNDVIVLDAYNGSDNDNLASYVYYENGNILERTIEGSEAINGEDINYIAMDISGDGMLDILALTHDGYKIYKFSTTANMYLYSHGTCMTKDIYPFPNDFNGDGKIDMLYYDPKTYWNIAFSKGNNFAEPLSCNSTYLLSSVVLGNKDKYQYSLKELGKPNVTIRTADFDGDGVSDVGVFRNMAGNYYLELGLMPYVKSDNAIGFAYEKRYYMPINYSHQTIHIGRFLAQENVSVLSCLPPSPLSSQKAYLTSLYPNSSYYGVERIVDGMGNSRGFSYDYLMHKKCNKDNQFYTCDNKLAAYDIRKSSVPISALRSDTIYNVNGTSVVSEYKYHNALIHAKGHGFIGFEKVTSRNYVNGNLIQKQEQSFDYNVMKEYSLNMPSVVRVYYGENKILKEKMLVFDKYVCASNNKVIYPHKTMDYELEYNFDRKGDIERFTITQEIFDTDIQNNGMYENVVSAAGNAMGITDNISAVTPYDCKYVSETYTVYDNDISNWIINRPKAVYKSSYDRNNELVGTTNVFSYDENIPTNVVKEIKLPNLKDDYSDPLLMTIEYVYDKVGNVVRKTMSSPSVEHTKTVAYKYDESYRYKVRTTNELDVDVNCKYDENYGLLKSTLDYNGFETVSDINPTGVDDVVTLPDGTQNAKAIRWSLNHDCAPEGASYYCWEKSSGNAETLVFYHKSGMELRRLTYDINGNAVFVDKLYDDFGNVVKTSLPYYENDEILYVVNVYDEYNRIVSVSYPHGLENKISYNGNDVIVETLSYDGSVRYKKDTYNVMDWLVTTEDTDGNKVEYEYYSDGLIKSAQIGKDVKTKVSVTYDNCRNRKSLRDPNYGDVLYEYDAFGDIMKITTPNNGVMEFKYDASGRMIGRHDIDGKSRRELSVRWCYDNAKGKKGLLKKIVTSDNHQVAYEYDEKLRLIHVAETINGVCYNTSYAYDAANRVSSIMYPSGLSISKIYSNSGFEKEIRDADTDELLWKTKGTNSNGNITECCYGNGVKTSYKYNPKTFLVDNIYAMGMNEVIMDLKYVYDSYGNVILRSNSAHGRLVEEFEYDNLDRLVKTRLNGWDSGRTIYDNYGNICEKEVDDVRVLYSAAYDSSKPNAIVKAKTDDAELVLGFQQDIRYSSFDNVLSIDKDEDMLEIFYGYDNNRVYMKSKADGVVRAKTYVGDCEFVEEEGLQKSYTFVNGPDGVFAVCVTDDKGHKSFYYIHKDNIGSWNAITDEDGFVVQERSFDVWGNLRNPNDWGYSGVEKSLMFDRGFTGHEHIPEFGLINMNGRMYDSKMSMMLSPDNNIQIPQLAQNFNRYSYCLNNPLKYNDPTGETVEGLAFGLVGGAVNVLLNANNIDSWGEAGLLFGVGFAKGFLTEYTMGGSWLLQVGMQTVMGGVSSGVNQMVLVGDGTFKFTGDNWNSVRSSFYYGIGNSLVKSFMNTYFTAPTDEHYGERLMDACYNKELGNSMTALAAHGMGCLFSGKPFLESMRFKDVGFDLKMLGCIAGRLLVSQVCDTQFADNAIKQRGQEIKDSIMQEMLSEYGEAQDFEYTYEFLKAYVENSRIYVVGNVFALIPGEILDCYPKPYMEEVVVFPFSYSLFKTLFFNNQ